jgi:hypothetical protein
MVLGVSSLIVLLVEWNFGDNNHKPGREGGLGRHVSYRQRCIFTSHLQFVALKINFFG